MVVIKFSELCRILYPLRKGISSQSSFVVFLFQAIHHPHFLFCNPDDNYAAKLFRGGTKANPKPITQKLRDATPKPFPLMEAYQFFQQHLQQASFSSVFKELSIDETKEKDFDAFCLACAHVFEDICQNEEQYISTSFYEHYLKALANPNLEVKNDINFSETDYVLEMQNRCPLCPNTNLTYTWKGSHFRNFRITKIYPSSLEMSKELSFDKIKKKPDDLESSDNKIAVCLKHFDLYQNTNDESLYRILVYEKEKAITYKYIMKECQDYDFQNRLTRTLDYLISNNSFEPTSKLNENALCISSKIPKSDYFTYELIKSLVSSYYYRIDDFLSKIEAKYDDKSTEFGRKIKYLSDSFMKLGYSPLRVIKELTAQLDSSLPDEYKDTVSCIAIVAYFIQHCEVLSYEIS